jgi:hypothetical protein
MFGKTLHTVSAELPELRGRFRLILFSGSSAQQLGRVALLDCEGDGIELLPYAPDYEFRVVSHLSPQEAIAQAETFIGGHPAFQRSLLAKIVTAAGTVVGFEVRPLYTQPAFGTSDVLDILYHQHAQGISVSIRLQSAVERQLSGN